MAGQEHDNDADFSILFDLVARLVDAPGGSDIAEGQAWLNDRQTLAKKFIYHLSTIQSIRGGSVLTIDGAPHEFRDHGSLTILIRAVLENYIVFAYLFGDANMEVCHFRHMCWRYGGLLDRQKLMAITQRARDIQAADKIQSDKLLESIKMHAGFEALSDGARKAIFKGKWDGGQQWRELAVVAGLSPSYFRTVYSYLCDYSHSSYAAALQVGQADSADQEKMSKSLLGVMNFCMSKFAFLHVGCFDAGLVFLDDAKYRHVAKKWNISAERFEEIYGQGAI